MGHPVGVWRTGEEVGVGGNTHTLAIKSSVSRESGSVNMENTKTEGKVWPPESKRTCDLSTSKPQLEGQMRL